MGSSSPISLLFFLGFAFLFSRCKQVKIDPTHHPRFFTQFQGLGSQKKVQIPLITSTFTSYMGHKVERWDVKVPRSKLSQFVCSYVLSIKITSLMERNRGRKGLYVQIPRKVTSRNGHNSRRDLNWNFTQMDYVYCLCLTSYLDLISDVKVLLILSPSFMSHFDVKTTFLSC